MSTTAPADAREALDMVRAGLGYLAAADASQLATATQAECLRELEQHDAMATAARAGFLAAFTAGQGPAGDGDSSAVSWLIHRTGITRGAAVGHSAWSKRTAAHPTVLAALAAGTVSESVGRLICLWTDKLPQQYRDAADEQLLAAFEGGLGLADLAALFAEMYVRAWGDLPDQDPDRDFADREVKLATTIGGAGVIHGDLTAECAAAVAAVLDALSAPAGNDDDRTKGQRYHDALQEAMHQYKNCIVISITSASLVSVGRRPYGRRGCCRARLPRHRPQPGRPSLHCAITGLPGRQAGREARSRHMIAAEGAGRSRPHDRGLSSQRPRRDRLQDRLGDSASPRRSPTTASPTPATRTRSPPRPSSTASTWCARASDPVTRTAPGSSPPARPWPRSSGPCGRSTPTWISARSGTTPRTA